MMIRPNSAQKLWWPFVQWVTAYIIPSHELYNSVIILKTVFSVHINFAFILKQTLRQPALLSAVHSGLEWQIFGNNSANQNGLNAFERNLA